MDGWGMLTARGVGMRASAVASRAESFRRTRHTPEGAMMDPPGGGGPTMGRGCCCWRAAREWGELGAFRGDPEACRLTDRQTDRQIATGRQAGHRVVNCAPVRSLQRCQCRWLAGVYDVGGSCCLRRVLGMAPANREVLVFAVVLVVLTTTLGERPSLLPNRHRPPPPLHTHTQLVLSGSHWACLQPARLPSIALSLVGGEEGQGPAEATAVWLRPLVLSNGSVHTRLAPSRGFWPRQEAFERRSGVLPWLWPGSGRRADCAADRLAAAWLLG
jgi:hypothetical protein